VGRGEEESAESHEQGVKRIGLNRVSRSERRQGDREKPKEPALPVNSAPPAQTQCGETHRERNHRHFKGRTGEKGEPEEGQEGQAQWERQTVHRTGERYESADTVDVV